MLARRGRITRMGILIASSVSSIADAVRGQWRSPAGRRWLVPLLIFLCVTGLVLTLAATVEALAPFIYSVF
jgi:Family of unknown function (DUF5989)